MHLPLRWSLWTALVLVALASNTAATTTITNITAVPSTTTTPDASLDSSTHAPDDSIGVEEAEVAEGGCDAQRLARGDFPCADGRCVAAHARCNGVFDCTAGDDESVALCGCLPNEFRCSNSCVDLLRRCDRRPDCEDGADEVGCETFVCPSTHFKCGNHFCVPDDKRCNFEDDCGDSSDEKTCSHRSCWKTEFKCDNGECIRPGFVCDGVIDCHDASDERHCGPGYFVNCSDGTRVHKQYWCDDWPDCRDNHADELNCSACDADDEFLCPNGRCIARARVCDAHCDCAPPTQHTQYGHGEHLPCADEDHCTHSYQQRHGIVVCEAGHALPCAMPDGRGGAGQRCVPPRFQHCFAAPAPAATATPAPTLRAAAPAACANNEILEELMQCENSSYSVVPRCNFKWDCILQDYDSESGGKCSDFQFPCDNGQCINGTRETVQCDLHYDCLDKSDELHCDQFSCPPGTKRCSETLQCLREELWCDYHIDCPDESDESQCERRECTEEEFQCANGQCIPNYMQCYKSGLPRDGCADESHLRNCMHWNCKSDTFKCRNGPCLNFSLVCNLFPDCPNTWTDEDGCVFQCADVPCQCQDRRANCSRLGLHSIPEIEDAINRFFLGDNFLNVLHENNFTQLDRLVYLDLKNNSISWLPPRVFHKLWRLSTLDLRDNHVHVLINNTFYGLSSLTGLHLEGNCIQVLESMAFYGLSSLTTLDLRHQKISNISNGAFIGLRKLLALLLSHNEITYLADGTFSGLPALHKLELNNNNIKIIDSSVFRSLSSLKILVTDEFRFCCLARHVAECLPHPDEFSSCEDLMSNLVLRVCVWILGVTATVGNALVIIWRMRFKHTNQVHSFLITNLAIGDLFMGTYLLIIATVDAKYRGVYMLHDSTWRSSELCSLAGFISTFSSELSVFTLTVITLDRFLVIIFPFRVRRLEMHKTRLVMAAGWIGAAVLSGLPLLKFDYFRNFYGRSGVCLALHITPEKPNGWEYSVFVFLFLNLASFSIIALGYVWMYAVARTTRQAVCHREQRPSDAAMARRMTLIVATDAACWMPIILLGALSLGGITVPDQVFAWVAVFVLPLNAAVNPVLYTLSTAPFLGPARRGLRSFQRSCKRSLTNDQRRTYSSSLGSTYPHSRYEVDNAVASNYYMEMANGKQAQPPVAENKEECALDQTTLFSLTKHNVQQPQRWRSGSYHSRSSSATGATSLSRTNSCHHRIDTAVSARGEIIPLRKYSPDRYTK